MRHVILSALAGGLLVCVSPQIMGQSLPSASQIPIAARQELPGPANLKATAVEGQGIFQGPVCGPEASVYFRGQLKTASAYQAPLTRINADGSNVAFDLRKMPGANEETSVMAFGLGDAGELYALVYVPMKPGDHEYLAGYSPSGEFEWKGELAVHVIPSVLLPIGNDEFLISGMTMKKPGEKQTSVTGLFDRDGREIKSLKQATDDESAMPAAQPGAMRNPAIEMSEARLGPDGLIYLFRASAYPKILIFNKKARGMRAMQLTPPVEGSQPVDFFVDGSSFLVSYQEPYKDAAGKMRARMVWGMYSAATGQLETSYVQKAPGIVACVKEGTMTFVAPTPDRHIGIGSASLQAAGGE